MGDIKTEQNRQIQNEILNRTWWCVLWTVQKVLQNVVGKLQVTVSTMRSHSQHRVEEGVLVIRALWLLEF